MSSPYGVHMESTWNPEKEGDGVCSYRTRSLVAVF
jgi:hypothetical protein